MVVTSLRRQLPVYSPLSGRALAATTLQLLRKEDPTNRLRTLLADRFEALQVQLFGTGTQALTAAIRHTLRRVGLDRPVALPAFTCYDVATAAVGADARILLYDVKPTTLSPDWSSLKAALEDGAGVVVLSPLYGLPFDWDTAEELAAEHGAALIEDAAQGAGGRWNGRRIGAFGRLSVLSFGRGKGWTGGNGGALLFRGDHLPIVSEEPSHESLRTAAATLAQWILARPALYGLPQALPCLQLGETRYHPPRTITGISPFSAALLLETDAAAEAEIEARQQNARALVAALQTDSAITPIQWREGATPGFLRLPTLAPRAATLARRHGALGIESSYPTTLLDLEAVRARLASSPPQLPGASRLAAELVTLPTHTRTTAGDRRRLIGALRS